LAKGEGLRYDPAMFWLRWIFFSLPLWLGFGGAWLFRTVAEFQLTGESDAIVHAIDGPIGYLSPLVPADGVEGEIADLLYEPLLRRDASGTLSPNLIRAWTSRTLITIRCDSEEAAGEAEARILAGEVPESGARPIAVDRSGSILMVAFEGHAPDLERAVLGALPPELLGDYLLVKVRADHSVDDLIRSWLAGSVEKAQVGLLEFIGDREAFLFVQGESDRVVNELRRYLASNPATSPRLDLVGRRCHTTVREMLLDLREDVTWHDGTPFTSRDVAFSHERLTRPDSPLPLAASFDFVELLEVLSPARLRILCREVPATMLDSWEKLPILPSHHLGKIAETVAEADEADLWSSFLMAPVGLGPYRLDRRREDGGVELVAHAAYPGGAPAEPRLRYRRYSSLESLLLALRTGTLDLIEPEERFTEWTRRHPGLTETLRDRPRFQHLVVWNLGRAPLDREPVRIALARGIDLSSILRDTNREYQLPVKSLFHPGSPLVAEPLLLPLYDPRGAERLLEKEGYRRDDESGVREDGKGRPLAFSLAVNADNPEHRRLAEALAEQWSGIGIEVEVEPLPWQELLTERLPHRDFDAVMVSWEIPLGRDRREAWHSAASGPGGGNLSGLRDAEVDKMLDQIRSEPDPVKVMSAIASFQRAIAARQPCLFLCDTGRILTLRAGALESRAPGAAAPSPLAIGKAGLAEVRPWWVKKKVMPP
jgi:peptide/nickel transport system substrate-binding protein